MNALLPHPFVRQLDHFFDTLGGLSPQGLSRVTRAVVPAVNVWQDTANVYVEAEVPGVPSDSIEVSYENGTLTIQATIPEQVKEIKNATFLHRERVSGAVTRSLTINENIDRDQITAESHNGVLLVTLPKHTAAQPRKIAVAPAR